jgi:hypothetical protein
MNKFKFVLFIPIALATGILIVIISYLFVPVLIGALIWLAIYAMFKGEEKHPLDGYSTYPP